MTKGITEHEPDPRVIYGDIIDKPHWQSPTRPHMSLYDRAAQFAPFAALTGYDDMITEEARLVDNKIELDNTEIEVINQKLEILADSISNGEKPEVSITYFVPDLLKNGGKYETVTEVIKKIDIVQGQLVLERKVGVAEMNATIDIKDILEIHDVEV
jgi:hypothetical protein